MWGWAWDKKPKRGEGALGGRGGRALFPNIEEEKGLTRVKKQKGREKREVFSSKRKREGRGEIPKTWGGNRCVGNRGNKRVKFLGNLIRRA